MWWHLSQFLSLWGNYSTEWSPFADFEYVIGDYELEKVINFLPKHSIEEVCQIAARKILGTTADERYTMGDNEIKQLDNK